MSKGQRRKGNAKTASSAQAADLLGAGGFIGFDIGFTNVFENVDSEFTNIDTDVAIILKKLSKKDPQTREKALRELIDCIPTKSVETIENIFSFFITAFPKLALDGSPTVRQLSLKCLALFILSLKKASEKHLKKLISFVLICTCDLSSSVCTQAEDLLRSCFPEGKAEKVIQLFSEDTSQICCDFIKQTHSLFKPQKYDEEETAAQRESRITTECLNLLSKLSEKSTNSANQALELYEDTARLKKILQSSTPQTQSGLLNLAQKLPSSYNLSESPISLFAFNNLDNGDATIGLASFNMLNLLLSQSSETFFKKFDVKKAVIPQVHSIVRKKLGHWRYCGPFLLPIFASILNQLNQEEALTFGLNFLTSFLDSMPFTISSVSVSTWSTAFVECCKYFVSRVSTLPLNIIEQAIPIILNMVEKADLLVDDVQSDIVNLIRWLCDKKPFPLSQMSSLINNLEFNLINRRPYTDGIITKLFSLHYMELANFHRDALYKADVPLSFIVPLAKAEQEYFTQATKDINLLFTLSQAEFSFGGHDVEETAVVALRLLQTSNKNYEIPKLHSQLTIAILKEWNQSSRKCDMDISTLLDRLKLDIKDSGVVLSLMNVDPVSKPIITNILINIFMSFKDNEKNTVVYQILGSADHNSIDFILKLIEEVDFEEKVKEDISIWLLLQYFSLKFPDWKDIVNKIRPAPERIKGFFPELFSNMDTIFTGRLKQSELQICNPIHYLQFHERLITLCDAHDSIRKSILVSSEFFEFVVNMADELLVTQELASSTPFVDISLDYPSFSNRSESEILTFIDRLITAVPVYLALLNTKKFSDVDSLSLAFFQVVSVYIKYVLEFIRNRKEYEDCINTISTFFEEDTSRITKVLLFLTQEKYATSSVIHKVLFNIRQIFPENVKMENKNLPLSMCCALGYNYFSEEIDNAERFLTEYLIELQNPSIFIADIHKFCTSEDSSWQEESRLFSAKARDPHMWQLNIIILQAANHIISKDFNSLSSGQLDFILCGLVVVFETSDDIYANDEPSTLQCEALLGNAIILFKTCCQAHKRLGVAFSDWKDFYYPFISRIIVRIWSKITIPDVPNLARRELVNAVCSFIEIPQDLGLWPPTEDPKHYPYDVQLAALVHRSLKGIRANSYLDQYSSLHVLKLISAQLFRLDNGEWEEEEKDLSSSPQKLKIPVPFQIVFGNETDRGFPQFACLRAALEPLKSDNLAETEKLLYCESFAPIVSIVLPGLIQAIQDRDREEYQLFVIKSIGSPVIQLSSILFETCSLIPAVVRSWYNALPKQAQTIVNKFILDNVSQELITSEFSKVKEENKKAGKKEVALRIRFIPHTRQITAEYTVDETKMILTITMPENYPLAVPEIVLEKAIVPSTRAKKWLLQLTSYLFYQNGSIVNGIQQWKQNVDKDVEGAEACCICMMTIHSNSHQLPRVQCKQCKNKFHSTCLYKWFDSSNNTACPLCRTSFT